MCKIKGRIAPPSFFGHLCVGTYARCALARLNRVTRPSAFCGIVTPHLGVCTGNWFVRFFQKTVATFAPP